MFQLRSCCWLANLNKQWLKFPIFFCFTFVQIYTHISSFLLSPTFSILSLLAVLLFSHPLFFCPRPPSGSSIIFKYFQGQKFSPCCYQLYSSTYTVAYTFLHICILAVSLQHAASTCIYAMKCNFFLGHFNFVLLLLQDLQDPLEEMMGSKEKALESNRERYRECTKVCPVLTTHTSTTSFVCVFMPLHSFCPFSLH